MVTVQDKNAEWCAANEVVGVLQMKLLVWWVSCLRILRLLILPAI
jgi:hypothetical protein